MSGDILTASGTKYYIGPAKTESEADSTVEFAALTWVEVGLVEDLGEIGDESPPVTGAVLGDGRTRKAKGARDAGTLSVICFHAPLDAGQIAMEAAEATKNNFTFKIVLPDRPEPTGTDTIQYFRGLVMSKRKRIGTNDNIIRRVFNVAVNSQIFEVPAAEAP